jgi:hypothetical protein
VTSPRDTAKRQAAHDGRRTIEQRDLRSHDDGFVLPPDTQIEVPHECASHLDLELTGRNLPAGSTLDARLATLGRLMDLVKAS